MTHDPSEAPERPRLFGTDGVRGVFGRPPLDELNVRRLGAALAQSLRRRFDEPRAVLGGDTRDSTPTIAAWLAAELRVQGVAITWLGVAPTPAITYATRRLEAACGIAVSASHNPYPDNGIKLIDGRGFKLAPQAEARIEAAIVDPDLPTIGGRDGLPEPDEAPLQAWQRGLASSLQETDGGSPEDDAPLAGLRVALDVAHGAATRFAGPLFARLGAEVEVLHDDPDGANINEGSGSTHPEALARRVVDDGFDLGIAFDGDADRAILVDETGAVRDGDSMLYLWARDLDARGALHHRRIVATSMSNLGLEVALQRGGIGLVRCDVGDREVVKTLLEHDLVLGGEQSGHIVQLDLATTGDGLLTGLQLAGIVRRAERPLSQLLDDFEPFPQLLRGVRVASKPPLDSLPAVVKAREAVEQALGGDGRLVLRYSGTEPLVRIMIEGRDRDAIEALADDLEAVLRAALGAA